MDKNLRRNQNEQKQNDLSGKIVEATGFLFPQTVDEVIEFERKYGRTDFILPDELQNTRFCFNKKTNSFEIKISKQHETFAMAAREGTRVLPMKIKKQILADIKKVESGNHKKSK